VCFGPSSGPEIKLFQRFKQSWPNINQKPQDVLVLLINAPNDIKDFITHHQHEAHIREDYLELLQLAAHAVGIPVHSTIHKPAAVHRARWMSKAIYALKLQLLSDGNDAIFQLTNRERSSL
jgi:hypothetical protein